jgi:hypothetical protein
VVVTVTPFGLPMTTGDSDEEQRRALSTDAAIELTSDALLPLGAIAGASPVSLEDSKALFTTT